MQRKLFFLACSFFCASCFAQQYPFVYYTPKDGLVNSRVRSIMQDSRGRMHFITFGGLSIYDGKRFINYSQEDGLANELVNDVAELGQDSFLIATNTQKLNTLIRGKLGDFKTADDFCPVINRLYKSRDGELFASADEGLFVLKNNCFRQLLPLDSNGKKSGIYLDKITEWNHLLFLIPWNPVSNQQLFVYDRLKKKISSVYVGEKVQCITADARSRVWLSTSLGVRMLDTSALIQGRIVFCPLPAGFEAVANFKNGNIYFDPTGCGWFYTGNQIIKIVPGEMPQFISAAQGLGTTTLVDLRRDREGCMWMACDGNGIIKLRNMDISLITNLSDKGPTFISAMTQASDTTWFFNLDDNSVYRFHKNKLTSFHLPPPKLKALYMYTRGKSLYMCNLNEMVCIRDKDNPDSYKEPRIDLQSGLHNFIIGNGIVDPDGYIILPLTRDSECLISVMKNGKSVMEYRLPIISDQMCLDASGNLWATSRDNHIMVFARDKGDPSHYLHLLREYRSELPEMSPRSIAVDSLGFVWVGTRYHGVFQFQLKRGRLIVVAQYTTHNGLTDNFAYTLKCGDNNTIWVGTQTGLDKIFLRNGKYIIGNVSKNNNYFQSIYKIILGQNHIVWALTREGSLLRVAPPAFFPAAPPPQIILSSLLVNNNLYNGSKKEFPHDENNFTFSLAAPSFADEKSIRFSYQLEGSSNTGWSLPSNSATFNFINLSPGKYKLSVRADFPEGLYNSQYLNYPFTILLPWWKSWWFISVSILALLCFTAVVIRIYYRQKLTRQKYVLEKKQIVEKERTRIATDMHDDLGAGLSRIKFLSEMIGIKKQQKRSIEEDIGKIRQYADEMIDKMGEIVWALNERNDSLSDLIAYTRAYAMEYLSQSGINCTFECDEIFAPVFLSGEYRRNIFLSVKESLHNVVKHAQANEVQIIIQAGEHLDIIIHDDGVGLDQSTARPFSNGLTNMRKRMNEIGGLVELTNKKGTTVELRAPLGL